MPNFNHLNSLSRADALLKAATPAFVAVNAAYVAGDHLQDGAEWSGPLPPPEMEREAMKTLERIWTPAPVVNECLENHTSGIVGREMAFEIALAKPPDEGKEPDAGIEARRSEINAALGRWFDNGDMLSLLQEWAGRLRWAGRAPLRLFVPPGVLENGRLPSEVDSPEKALEYICLMAPNVEAATVALDPATTRKCGLFLYDEILQEDALNPQRRRRLEKVFVADADEAQRDGRPAIRRGQTVLQVLAPADEVAPVVTGRTITINPRADEADRVISEVVFECGGQSLIFEAKAPLLFTDPARRLQRAINLLNTLLAINATYAGFRSRDYFNVSENSAEETAPGATPEPVETGPSRALFWYAQPYKAKNADGTEETHYLPPTLVTTEPVESEPLLALKMDYERQLRRQFRQEHTLNSGADISAVALIQQRAAFHLSLLGTKPAVEAAVTWLQSAAWCFACYLCGQEGRIAEFKENYRATCTAKPFTGPLSPDEIRVIIEQVKARLMPREVAAGLLGTDDLDAFIEAIDREDASNPEMMLKRVQIYATLRAEGESKQASATVAGLGEEEIRLLGALGVEVVEEASDAD